jgi:hypothetical protein
MEPKVFKMPSIEHLRNVIHQVTHKSRYRGDDDEGQPIYEDCELPTLTFRGSVKMHGTNAGIVFMYRPNLGEYQMHTQSKGGIITPTKDNMGFSAFAFAGGIGLDLLPQILELTDGKPEVIRVYGEWVGGKIQKGTPFNSLDRMFVIFGIKADNIWLPEDNLVKVKLPKKNIYNILDYPTFNITIDFNNPKEAAEIMGDLVTTVEEECPVGKAFGIEKGVGEGIVWVCTTEGWGGSRYWFKTKGDKHKSSGTKEKVPVDIERLNSISELVDSFLTESRLMQGLDQMRENNQEFSRKSTGFYVQWVSLDIVKEELDTIVGNGFDVKEITKTASVKAKNWFFKELDKGVGL